MRTQIEVLNKLESNITRLIGLATSAEARKNTKEHQIEYLISDIHFLLWVLNGKGDKK